jgi:hypothetical protein
MSEDNLLPHVVLSRYEEDSEAEECVSEVIDTVLERVSECISRVSVGVIQNGLMAEVAMYKLSEVVHLATVKHDGECVSEEVLEVLRPDEEPVPAPVDNWARGTGECVCV